MEQNIFGLGKSITSKCATNYMPKFSIWTSLYFTYASLFLTNSALEIYSVFQVFVVW